MDTRNNSRPEKKTTSQTAPVSQKTDQVSRDDRSVRSERTERDAGRPDRMQKIVLENDLYERQSL